MQHESVFMVLLLTRGCGNTTPTSVKLFPVAWRIVAVGALWTSIWWLIIGALIAPVIPGGWLTIATAIILAVAPLFVLVQRFRGAYPGTFIRLFVFRPFWYIQLSTPIVALGGVIGFIVSAPLGAAVIAGRWAIF